MQRVIPGFVVMGGGEMAASVVAGSAMLSGSAAAVSAEVGLGLGVGSGFDGEGVVGMGMGMDGVQTDGGTGGFGAGGSGSFFITFAEARFLDGKCVVVGRVVEGWDVLRKVEKVRTREGDRPVNDVVVAECGEM